MTRPASNLQISGLQFRRGSRVILDGIDLHLQSGAVTAVLGPNGAGKSTLLSCIAGLLSPERGSIELDGASLHSLAAMQRARRIAFLPQTPEIAWSIDVQTLVGLGRIPFHGVCSDEEDRAAVAHAMTRTEVAQWADRTVTTLSGGERARVLLARVLAGESDWILADEPFTGLDPSHQFEAAELLRAMAVQGGGVVLTIHDLTLAARIADRVIIIDAGRIVADGTPQDALTPQILRDVYNIDAQWLNGANGTSPTIAIHGRATRG
ncbi:ABC transporter ATP-binding protein [Steroidobacter cummioxidans]|uniref:ABC transporter ATP-binding protein n=1 Tax=Steroidobacter cummioxidans TaxID=1803913 RepID=UPI000E32381D|nr:ABC transporter ATP-binding protein [Steroidobacter cummioxidans]